MRRRYLMLFLSAIIAISGCAVPKIKLFSDDTEPLREFTLQGKKKGKVLLISVKGIISDEPQRSFLRPKPSMVQEIVSQLQLAEKDKDILAVILKIDSPGGSTTASDILYHEIKAFKERKKVKIVAVMMNLAASGGYYVSLPADHIIAHPTTVTGSIGVIFIRPKIVSLMEKVGLAVEVDKSGKNKDMGSLFREATDAEKRIFREIVEDLGDRFVNLVIENRKLSPEAVDKITSARVYLANDALDLNLIDEIGYLSDGIKKAKGLSDLPEDAKVIVYRRTKYPDDNLYNTSTYFQGIQKMPLIDLNVPDALTHLRAGFYYLWAPFGGTE